VAKIELSLSLITKEGNNPINMAAWYYSIKMLEAFWFDLIKKNSKGIVYFHNWAE
jgi:hypothetical protein